MSAPTTESSTTTVAADRAALRPGTSPGRRAAGDRRRFNPVALGQQLGALVVVLVAWTLFARGPGADADFPTPLTTARTAVDMFGTSIYWQAVLDTVVTMVIGFVLSVAVGVPIGLLIGSYRRVRWSTQFLVDFGRTIPGIAILPILLLNFGNTRTMALALILFGGVWPLIIQSSYAVQQVSPHLQQVASAFRLTRRDRFRFVFAPSVLPFLMTGLRLSAAISLILTITAEYLGQVDGVGANLQRMHEIHDPPRMFVYMFTAAALGMLLTLLVVAIQRRVLWWHPSERKGR